MGFLKRMFRVGQAQSQNWRRMGHAQLTEAASAFLTEVAQHAGLADAVVAPLEGKRGADLRATLEGYPLRVVVDTVGRMEVELQYERALAFMDLTYDPDLEQAPARPAAKAWKEEETRHTLVPGITLRGDEELAAFHALAPELQQRVLREMYLHRARHFRSRPDHLQVDFFDSFQEEPSPVEQVAAMLRLGVDVSRARGARPPGTTRNAPFDAQHPSRGWEALSDEERRARLQQFVQWLATQHPDSRVIERHKGGALEVRWTEAGCPVRITFENDDVLVSARVENSTATFELNHDADVTVEGEAQPDAWDEVERYVFFGPGTYVLGNAREVRAEAATLRSLPEGLVDELVQELESEMLHWAKLSEGVLRAYAGEFDGLRGGGNGLLRVAHLFARIAVALPKGASSSALSADAVQCTYCRGYWFPGPQRQRCTHCGAPLQK
jgi:hypothetical protein